MPMIRPIDVAGKKQACCELDHPGRRLSTHPMVMRSVVDVPRVIREDVRAASTPMSMMLSVPTIRQQDQAANLGILTCHHASHTFLARSHPDGWAQATSARTAAHGVRAQSQVHGHVAETCDERCLRMISGLARAAEKPWTSDRRAIRPGAFLVAFGKVPDTPPRSSGMPDPPSSRVNSTAASRTGLPPSPPRVAEALHLPSSARRRALPCRR